MPKLLDMTDTASLMWKTISPVFITMGTLGNVLCIAVLTRPSNRKSSTAVYLTALAFSDLVVIYTGLMRWWLIHLIDVDVRHLGNVVCKLHWFFIFASTENSSWILVAVTCERIISTKWPHRVRAMCTHRSAMYIVILINVVIYGGSAHLVYGMELRLIQQTDERLPTLRDTCITSSDFFENDTLGCNCSDTVSGSIMTTEPAINAEKLVCAAFADDSYKEFFYYVYPWMDLVIYFLFPAVILSIGDVIIIHKIISSRRLRLSMMVNNQIQCKQVSSKSLSLTIMLLTVNAVFILCTTPISVYLIGIPYWVDQDHGFTDTQAIVWAAVNLLMYLNHSINFLLYFLSGSRFRHKVYDTFRKRNRTSTFQTLSAGSRSESVHGPNNTDTSHTEKNGLTDCQGINVLGLSSGDSQRPSGTDAINEGVTSDITEHEGVICHLSDTKHSNIDSSRINGCDVEIIEETVVTYV